MEDEETVETLTLEFSDDEDDKFDFFQLTRKTEKCNPTKEIIDKFQDFKEEKKFEIQNCTVLLYTIDLVTLKISALEEESKQNNEIIQMYKLKVKHVENVVQDMHVVVDKVKGNNFLCLMSIF